MAVDDPGDLELLERFEPIIRFNQGEYFLPASVESFVARTQLWERTGPSGRTLAAESGTLDMGRLLELTGGHQATHYLRLVAVPLDNTDRLRWHLRRDRPRFRAETRLGRVGVLTRLVDAGGRLSLIARGRTPRHAEATAAVIDRDRPDHGDHPYYGRVVRVAGYIVVQYWFFYFFNDWRSRAYGVNDHEGDWEQVTVYAAESAEGSIEPAWVAFSAHDEVGPDLRRRWDDPDLDLVGEHPTVYAGLGSHAGAVLPGEYLITVRSSRYARLTGAVRRMARFFQPWVDDDTRSGVGIPYVEYQRGDGVAIGPGTTRPWRPVLVDDHTDWIRGYTGLWGDDTDDPFGGERGPAGPRYERNASVRQSWADPVGWAALDAVTPSAGERAGVVAARIAELSDEQTQIEDERVQVRGRLRAMALADVGELGPTEQYLADLAVRATTSNDELDRLSRVGDIAPDEHPHVHLRHRAVPLPMESKDRRRVLRLWATISTPLVFVLMALLVLPLGPSVLAVGAAGLFVVFAIEALSRGRLLQFAVRVLLLVVVVLAMSTIVVGLIASWQVTLAVVFILIAVAFFVLNLRELRRT